MSYPFMRLGFFQKVNYISRTGLQDPRPATKGGTPLESSSFGKPSRPKGRGFTERLSKLNRSYIVLAALGILTFLFYGNTLVNGFVLDDIKLIEKNEYLGSLKYFPKVLTGCLREFADGSCKGNNYSYYRPLHTLSATLSSLISLKPWSFHLANVIYFLLGAFLIFVFIKLLTKNHLIAFFAALFFAINPINSEVVNWASAVPEHLMTIFVLLCCIYYLKYRETGLLKHLIFVYLFFLFALFSKEPAILAPLILLSIDTLFLRKNFKEIFKPRELKIYSLFLLPIIIYFTLKISVVGSGLGGNAGYFTFKENINARVVLFVQYLKKALIWYPPSVFNPFEKSSNFLSVNFLISLTVSLIFLFLILFSIKTKRNIIAFFLIWFAVFLSPIIILLVGESDHMLAERYLFLPMIGTEVLFAYLSYNLFSIGPRTKKFIPFILIFFILISWTVIFQRNKAWKSEETLFLHTLKYTPNAHEVRFRLAEIYLSKSELEKARTEFEEIEKRNNQWKDISLAFTGLGRYYQLVGDKDKAIEYYLKAVENIRYLPRDYVTFNDLGVLYMQSGNYLKGFSSFCQAFMLYQSETISNNLDSVLSMIDSEYLQKGVLYKNIKKEFSISPHENIVFMSKECEKNECFFIFSNRGEMFDILLPSLILAIADSEKEIEITDRQFDSQRGEIMLKLDLNGEEGKNITFIFPTCRGFYYQVALNNSN